MTAVRVDLFEFVGCCSVTRRLRSGGRSARRSVSRISSGQPIGPTTKDHREMTAGPTTGVMHLGAVKSRVAINQIGVITLVDGVHLLVAPAHDQDRGQGGLGLAPGD